MALVHGTMARPPVLRSLNAEIQTHLQFVNSTDRNVNVYWVDYHGHVKLQFTLKPKSTSVVNTFLTHPWIFRDHDNGEFLQVNHLNVFLPQLYTRPNPSNPAQRLPCRKQIVIHFPLRTLRENCLWKVALSLMHNKQLKQVINDLELPRTIQKELRSLLELET